MDKKEHILKLYYEEHLKQKEIAKLVLATKQYISKIVRKDPRYSLEKDKRKTDNRIFRKEYLKSYFKKYNKKKEVSSDVNLQKVHESDVMNLSDKKGDISNYAFAKWNLSAYSRNKDGNLVIDKNLTVTDDVPKKILMRVLVPSQRY